MIGNSPKGIAKILEFTIRGLSPIRRFAVSRDLDKPAARSNEVDLSSSTAGLEWQILNFALIKEEPREIRAAGIKVSGSSPSCGAASQLESEFDRVRSSPSESELSSQLSSTQLESSRIQPIRSSPIAIPISS